MDETRRVKITNSRMKTVDLLAEFSQTLLLQTLSKECKESDQLNNIVLAPACIVSALMLLEKGAAGETLSGIQQALQGKGESVALQKVHNEPVKVFNDAVRVWISKLLHSQLVPEWVNKVGPEAFATADFVAQVEQTAARINKFVSDTTKGHLKKLVDSGDIMGAVLVLVTACHFKDNWLHEFDKKNTYDAEFFISSEQTISVPFMYQMIREKHLCTVCRGREFTALHKPYENPEFEMALILPKREGPAGLFDALRDGCLLGNRYKHQKANYISLTVPRFDVTQKLKLNTILQSMGMVDAFDVGKADFTRMVAAPEDSDKSVFIDAIIHKARVTVDEKGTEASGATAVIMRTSALIPEQLHFNRPFIFAVLHVETHAPFFVGIVSNPVVE